MSAFLKHKPLKSSLRVIIPRRAKPLCAVPVPGRRRQPHGARRVMKWQKAASPSSKDRLQKHSSGSFEHSSSRPSVRNWSMSLQDAAQRPNEDAYHAYHILARATTRRTLHEAGLPQGHSAVGLPVVLGRSLELWVRHAWWDSRVATSGHAVCIRESSPCSGHACKVAEQTPT